MVGMIPTLKLALLEADFDERIGPREGLRNPSHPVFAGEGLARPREVLFRKQARGCGKIWSSDFSANRAGRYTHLRIIADPLGLAHLAEGHHVELAVFLSEPYRGCNFDSSLAKSGQRNIFLRAEGGGNLVRHRVILEAAGWNVAASRVRSACGIAPLSARRIATLRPSVLQA
jgi:hypothetical protein